MENPTIGLNFKLYHTKKPVLFLFVKIYRKQITTNQPDRPLLMK
jgi:hypothetical protein